LVPEFVNPKYADASKNKFKKPTRLECMMQDHPKVLGPDAIVGFTEFPDWTYSPVKNSVDEGRAKILVGAPGRTAAEGELEYYGSGGRQLAAIGVTLPEPQVLQVFGFDLQEPAKVVFAPSFAPSFSAAKARFLNPSAVSITARSSLVLEGDITVSALEIDGALVVRAVAGAHVRLTNVKVKNAGLRLVPLTAEELQTAAPAVRIRGFRVEKHEVRELVFDTPGEYEVNDA
jgi:UDP-sugar pyrophosphorylase